MPYLHDPKEFEAYAKHYTDLFIYQARQRLDSIRFFFVGFAVFANVIFSGDIDDHWVVIGLSVSAGVVSIVFMRLDFRNAQIVEIDEKPLKDLQEFARSRVNGSSAWRTFERCDVERKKFTSYGELVSVIYVIAWVSSFGFAVYLFVPEAKVIAPDWWPVMTIVVSALFLIIGGLSTAIKPRVLENFQLPAVNRAARISFPVKPRND